MVSEKAKKAVEEEKVVDTTINTATEDVNSNEGNEKDGGKKSNSVSKTKKTKEEKAADKAAKKATADEQIRKRLKEREYRKIGIDPDTKYTDPLNNDRLKSLKINICEAAEEDSEKYYNFLVNGGVINNYFSENDGEIFHIVNNFYNADYETPEGEAAIMMLQRFINIRTRQIIGKSFKNEKHEEKAVQNSFNKGEDIVKGLLSKKRENVLKEVAWIVTHAYLTGLLNVKYIASIIPNDNEIIVPMWNNYISMQEDIPETVKKIFILDENCKCLFTKENEKDIVETVVEMLNCDHPTEDIPFNEDNKDNVIQIDFNKSEPINHINTELDNQYKIALENDNTIEDYCNAQEDKFRMNYEMDPDNPIKEFSFGQLKTSNTSTVNPAKIAENLQNQQNAVDKSDLYAFNNQEWEKEVPRLTKFTNCVTKTNNKVLYNADQEYLGLIRASIVDPKENKVIRELCIDPCLVYGNTLNVVTLDNMDKDLRKELFIPISKENIVVKAINGKITKDDRKNMSEKLPRALTDFREKYSFLDRVDMRGIETSGRAGMDFNEWKKLVINISNILKDPNTPICRFRISRLESADRFQLICDIKTLCAFPSKILYDNDAIEFAQKEIVINYIDGRWDCIS